jgi:protein-tyrosine phosphatase
MRLKRAKRALVMVALAFALPIRSASAQQPTTPHVEPTIDDMVRNVELATVLNARDLGGLRGSRGWIPHGRFYRAATLARVNDEDRKVLLGRGVTLDIDLRTFVEAEGKSDLLSHDARFTYERVSLLGIGLVDFFRANHLRSLYVHALDDHQASFREVFHAMATHGSGAVLYHCTSGKDRTGMVTALLLDLAGVDRASIVRDYAISAHYLHTQGGSPPQAMEAFLDALHTKYGGAHAFLSHAGVREAEIHALLAKLGQA